jgi:hypothetical protein
MEDLHRIWPHRWITPKAKSNSSKIHRLGVIATQGIKKGESVCVFGGAIVPKKEIDKYNKNLGDFGIQISDDFFIVPTTREELEETGVFNHSCDPNCGFSNSITLVAIRNVKKGEELTLDYAFSESCTQEFKCNCGSPNCRKIIKATDWKIPELQQKYRKYYSPYLKAKF